ncbi:MAG: FAD:protein FMN transferase [Finegoldia sp.]|nr:FAD:protein FMN transferase [Finegoldia sp.]
MKKYIKIILVTILALGLSACGSSYKKHEATMYDSFDTVIKLTAYTKSEDDFKKFEEIYKDEFTRLHKLYDPYKNYESITNVKTINDKAGIEPVKVDKDLFSLIKLSKDYYEKYGQKTNINMGAVTNIWKDYRDNALNNKVAAIPSMEELKAADSYTDLNDVVLNEDKLEVYLKNKENFLDLGAVAKGYATEIVANKLSKEGLEAGIINAGGNVRTIGNPDLIGKDSWKIAIQNPNLNKEPEKQYIATYKAGEESMVTSGNYQRFYEYEGKVYHHIIDPDTLMPANNFKSVTIITKDSSLADFLSTTVFISDYETGKKLVDSIDGVEAVWVFPDDRIEYTKNLESKLEIVD